MRVCDKCEKNSTQEEIESILIAIENNPGPRIEDLKADLCTECRKNVVTAIEKLLNPLMAVDDEQ